MSIIPSHAGRLVRTAGLGVFLLFTGLLIPGAAPAESLAFLRIGTGGEGGTYFPVGSLIAEAITGQVDLPGGQPLLAVAQLSNGSVSNIEGIAAGTLDAGLAQSDVIHWAFNATGTFGDRQPAAGIRAIANLYPESIHLVVRRDAGIGSVGDLRGRRVSLDEAGSGTLVDARIVLSAWGIGEDDIDPEYIKPDLALERMRTGQLDAFFIVAGFPARAIAAAAAEGVIDLVPVSGPRADSILAEYPFFSAGVVPAGTYTGIGEVTTLEVGAQLVVSADLDEGVVFAITRTLWSAETGTLLTEGHPKGGAIVVGRALNGLSIPLHEGAGRWYRENGYLE